MKHHQSLRTAPEKSPGRHPSSSGVYSEYRKESQGLLLLCRDTAPAKIEVGIISQDSRDCLHLAPEAFTNAFLREASLTCHQHISHLPAPSGYSLLSKKPREFHIPRFAICSLNASGSLAAFRIFSSKRSLLHISITLIMPARMISFSSFAYSRKLGGIRTRP